jgi:hypothetical protein
MPDCSAITIHAYPPRGKGHKVLKKLLEMDGSGWTMNTGEIDGEHYVWDPKDAPDSFDQVTWSDYDCPWGLNTPEEQGIFDYLTKHDIPWEANDYGHYTWDGEYRAWKPGMEEPFVGPAGVEGRNFVAVDVIREAIKDGGVTTLEAKLPPSIPV